MPLSETWALELACLWASHPTWPSKSSTSRCRSASQWQVARLATKVKSRLPVDPSRPTGRLLDDLKTGVTHTSTCSVTSFSCYYLCYSSFLIVLNLFYVLFYCIGVLFSYNCSCLHVCLSMWHIYICPVYVLWDWVLQIQDHAKGHPNSTGSACVVATRK